MKTENGIINETHLEKKHKIESTDSKPLSLTWASSLNGERIEIGIREACMFVTGVCAYTCVVSECTCLNICN